MSTPSGPPPRRAPRPDGDPIVVEGRASSPSRGLADPSALSPAMRSRRAVSLLLLTLVAPGSAQYIAGNRRLGTLALRVWGCTLGAVVLFVVLGLLKRSWLLGIVSRSWFLLLLGAALFVGAAFWALLFLDATRLAKLGRVPGRTRSIVAGGAAVLVALTSGPMVWAGANVLAGRSAVQDVFTSSVSKEASDGRFNVLLLGGDSGADRTGTRPDTMMLMSIDADTGRSVMFGFARDTENINFREGSLMKRLMPDGWNCGDKCLLNGLYTWAMANKSKFPADIKDPGVEATREAIESLSGLDVHYYALVDLKGFQRIIDAVGGLTIDVKKRVPIGGGTSKVSGYIETGVQKLDGYHALWYARSREGASNDERMARQRCVITAMIHQLNPQTVIFKFKDVAGLSGSVLTTDVPESDLGAFADLALKARSQKMKSVNFVQPLIKPWSYDPQVIKDTVAKTIEASKNDTAPARRTNSASSTTASTPSASSTAPSQTDPAADDVSEVCSAA